MRGLLNPLFVCPSASWPYLRPVRSYLPIRLSARPLVGPVYVPFALIRLCARPPVRSFARLLVCPSASIWRVVRPSAHLPLVCLSAFLLPHVRPSVHPPPVRPPARPSPPIHPRPLLSAPSASSKNYLSFSSAPKFYNSCTPREITTSAIHGASRSHSGIGVKKFPTLHGQP